jgi:hypothetical protein
MIDWLAHLHLHLFKNYNKYFTKCTVVLWKVRREFDSPGNIEVQQCRILFYPVLFSMLLDETNVIIVIPKDPVYQSVRTI